MVFESRRKTKRFVFRFIGDVMIKYDDIINNNCVLSPHQLQLMEYPNKNTFKLRNLLSRNLEKKDNGTDIGSNNYMSNSKYKFLKTRVANKENYIVDLSSCESFEYMNYKSFINQDLKKGDIIISKDSNIGECCILDKDYPDCMIASAFYKLPLLENKNYIFAFMKTDYFKNQLDLMVPRGATIRHAGTKFLDCNIPFPSGNDEKRIISKIESIVNLIIEKEKQIKINESKIFSLIQDELKDKSFISQYKLPSYNELIGKNRTDAGYYCQEFKNLNSLIKNYGGGYSKLSDFGYTISRGQNLQVSCIGKSIETEEYHKGFYKIAKPTNLSNYGTVTSYSYLGNKNNLSLLKYGDIVFSAEGTIGKCAMFSNVGNQKIITNIHGIILNKTNHNITESGFVCCFLRYLRSIGYFNYLSVGGQGGSLAMKYWNDVIIPNFSQDLMESISDLYCNNIYKNDIIGLTEQINDLKLSLNCIFNLIVSDEYIKYDDVLKLVPFGK